MGMLHMAEKLAALCGMPIVAWRCWQGGYVTIQDERDVHVGTLQPHVQHRDVPIFLRRSVMQVILEYSGEFTRIMIAFFICLVVVGVFSGIMFSTGFEWSNMKEAIPYLFPTMTLILGAVQGYFLHNKGNGGRGNDGVG